jgi:DNA-directed RNA polymerase subunit F
MRAWGEMREEGRDGDAWERERGRKVGNKADRKKHRMLSKTRDYLDHFARFKRKENVEAVERLLSAHKELAKFERAQLGMSFPTLIIPLKIKIGPGEEGKKFVKGEGCRLMVVGIGSLCCDTAEEAKTLVPSLQDKISDDDLQELLDEITKLMGYGN